VIQRRAEDGQGEEGAQVGRLQSHYSTSTEFASSADLSLPTEEGRDQQGGCDPQIDVGHAFGERRRREPHISAGDASVICRVLGWRFDQLLAWLGG
jgi:hypothetical protein